MGSIMPPPGKDDVVRLLGPVGDHTVVEILEAGASLEELELVAMRLAQENDVMGDMRKPLSARAARIYDIVMRDPLYAEAREEERRGT